MPYAPRLLAAALATVCVSLAAAPAAGALAAKPTKSRSTKGTKMRFSPKRGQVGATFKAAARGFAKGEPVTASETAKGRKASRLPGGTATRAGRVYLLRRTFPSSRPGKRRLCLRGERSRRVACAAYLLTPGADEAPEEETELQEEDLGSPEVGEEEEEEELEFVDDYDLLGLGEELDFPGNG